MSFQLSTKTKEVLGDRCEHVIRDLFHTSPHADKILASLEVFCGRVCRFISSPVLYISCVNNLHLVWADGEGRKIEVRFNGDTVDTRIDAAVKPTDAGMDRLFDLLTL